MLTVDTIEAIGRLVEWEYSQQQAAPPDPEWARCAGDVAYFIDRYCQIYDADAEAWIPFHLWPAQSDVLDTLTQDRLVVILKARQLGQTWLVLAYILHAMIFRPAQSVLLFSRRQIDAYSLLGPFRLKGMYVRLPAFLQPGVTTDNGGAWALSNGSVAKAFPLTAGDGETATIAFLDEADLPDDAEQRQLQRTVAPTVEHGQMILLSKVDKRKPDSLFKRIYRAAVAGTNGWTGIFLPWHVRPDRTAAWYAAERAQTIQNTGTEDDLWENYPATDAEALAPRSLDKRLPPAWVLACTEAEAPLPPLLWPPEAPTLLDLRVYRLPVYGRRYVGGVDPATGASPSGDASAITVGDVLTGEEVAAFAGVVEPAVFAAACAALSRWYHGAGLLIERNNRAFGVLDWLTDHAADVPLLPGDDGKVGWLSSSVGKVRLYDTVADSLRTQDAVIHSGATRDQLLSIERSTLRAPDGQHDDEADSYALMHAARKAPAPDSTAVSWGRYTVGR